MYVKYNEFMEETTLNQNEKILEFDKIKKLWQEYAVTDTAKQMVTDTVPYIAESELNVKLRETTESRELIETCGNPPVVSVNGIEEIISGALKGDCLAGWQLEKIQSNLTAVKRLKDYLSRGKIYNNPLAYYDENLDELVDLREEIRLAIYNEMVVDHASSSLQDIRRNIMQSEEKMREKADQVIRSNKEYMSDSFSTFRNGRICVPVKKEYKFKISGSVIDKSATGSTLFVEPTASAKYYEVLQQLRIDEEDEVKRILYTLTSLVALYADSLRQNIRMMEKLDFVFSKGKLSLHYDGVAPTMIPSREIHLVNAKHPLLDKTRCVPLNFDMDEKIRGVVITGPNTGGKTVAIKTVALCCMMAQCGLHVPCEKAEMCMFNDYLCDIGDGQNLSENLSTFSAHIKNVLEILKRVSSESMVIMDELGSGTDPQEGMGIAIAILEELRKSNALFLVTTHYPEVKNYAAEHECIINARMTFDSENLTPLYQMVIGEAGESCALYIAKQLGMPSYMLENASIAAYGDKSHIKIEDSNEELKKIDAHRIIKRKVPKKQKKISFQRGDSVMVYPDKKIGIVCKEANDKGVLQIQLQGKKIWINYKRVKLLVAAEALYPEDYDFSIIFDSVENRKLRHDMSRKYVNKELHIEE